MLLEKKLGFIGTGNMGEALVKGLLKAGAVRAEQVIGSEPRAERREEIAAAYGIRVTADNLEVVRASEIVVLSIKPQIMERVLDEIRCAVTPEKLVISIAAGISIASIEERLPPDVHVIRVMPNTPALVQAGATVIAPGEHATETDLALARAIFDAVSQTFILDESQMDAVTGLSGSGPAYIFLIIEALADAGVKVGLSRYVAQALAAQTVVGSAKLLIETNEHPGVLKDMVTSPGGTAIAGLHTLEAGGLRTTLINAVEAATKRSRELGEEMRRKRQA